MIWTLLGGFLATALLSAAVSSPATANGGTVASNNLGGVFGAVSKGVNWLVSPAVPAIPNRAASPGAQSSTTSPAPKAPSLTPNAQGKITAPANPITAPPAGATAPPRDYAPTTNEVF